MRGTNTRTPRPSLHRDDSGAIMVIGVFMAMLVTGFLYYIIGIGNTIIFRERMQDAADAVAFSGAVMHARGMNLIAMINIVMALLVSILFAMRLVQYALFAAAFFTLWAPPLSAALGNAGNVVRNFANTYENSVVQPALRLGHSAQDVIRTTWPYLAQTRVVVTTLAGTYQPPVTAGFIHPMIDHPLPVRPVNIHSTCIHAADPISRFITFPVQFIPGISQFASWITRMLDEAMALFFCPRNTADIRPHEIDPGDGSCNDGMPGQDCEYVQIRGIVIGTPPFQSNERGVSMAAWGRNTGSGGLFGTIGNLSRIGLAQAEYYYEGDEARDEWTWHMYWRARFRRFRMPTNLLGISGAVGPGIDLSLIDRVIIH
jgi:hypothetical protein